MILSFRGHFHRFSHQQSNSLHKFKDFKTFEFYGIQIETFEFTSAEYQTMKKTRLRNQNSNYMMKNTSRGPKNLFDLDHLSNYRSLDYMTSTVYNFV